MSRSDYKAMAQIILPYLLFGGLWILGSDRLLAKIVPDPAERVEWSIYKGWAYVLVTGILLALLLLRLLRSRERADAALREIDRRFSLIYRKSPLGITITRLGDGRFLDVNESFARTTGYSREETIGRTSAELNLWHDADEREEVLKRMRAGERIPAMEIGIRHKSGEVVPMLYSVERIDLAGEPCLIGMAQDISARKNMENALLERVRLQNQLSTLARVVPGAIYTFRLSPDGSMSFPFSSKAIGDLFGLPPENVNAGDVFARIHPDDLPRVRDSIQESARTLDIWRCEYRIVHPHRGILWIAGCATPQRDPDGSILWHGFSHDITERRAAREQLQRFLKASPAVLYVLRIDGARVHQEWISDNLQRITGWIPAESRDGSWWYENIHPEDKERVLEGRARVLERFGKSKLLEYRFRHKSGAWIWIRDEQRYQRSEEGDWIEAVGTWIDISEQKRLEANVLQMQKIETVGMLAGGIAHDFNNLLSVIKGYTELVLEEVPGDDPQRKNLEEILRASRQAAALTSQLLAFSRKQILQPEILDINDTLRETSKMLERLIGENIDLHLVLHPALAQVHADPGQFQQIIMNLAVNARDAMPDGGKLIIETANAVFDEEYARGHFPATPGEYVMLAVSDCGQGMDPSTQARIFEPFFTTKAKGKGTGLGLSTVYGIVKQSNGFIWVYSEVGKGTTFKVYLPRVESRKDPAGPEKQPEAELRGSETILVVEDEAPLCELTCRILRKKGYTVIPAADGAQALDRVAAGAGNIDMLVTDVLMPRMGGKELASRLKELFPEIRILYISGYTDHSIVHRGILDEGIAFLQKPFSMEGLAQKVRGILDGDA